MGDLLFIMGREKMKNLNQIKDSDPRIIKTENNRKLYIDGQNRNFPVYSIPLNYFTMIKMLVLQHLSINIKMKIS